MRIDAVTLFAPMFEALTRNGVTRRAAEQGIWSFHAWNPRDFTTDNYHTVDDRPYGGGPGMVMLCEPLQQALRQAPSPPRRSPPAEIANRLPLIPFRAWADTWDRAAT